jgi:tetratricopeptide (TPR) repeat protein
MTSSRRWLAALGAVLLASVSAADQDAEGDPSSQPAEKRDETPKDPPPPNALPHTKLAPARLFSDLCLHRCRISTSSKECQEFFDQGLGFYYSYAWMEAARSFETALQHDPNSAMCWWGLHLALEKWGKNAKFAPEALKKAQELLPKAAHNERLLITARLREKGLVELPKPPFEMPAEEHRRREAAKALDELITLYDDQEGWFFRAQLAGPGDACVPFYKGLLRLNPLHPGANHELVHFFENSKRPALGWPYAENYIKSSPGIPHAWHMQAHLAMRIGRWEKTSDRSLKCIDLQRAYHKEMGVKPNEDWQFPHHLEILTFSLVHDGRFREALAVKDEAASHGFNHFGPWFRLHLNMRDWEGALKIADQQRKTDKNAGCYMAALVYLRKGSPEFAQPDLDVLQQAYARKKTDNQLKRRLWEIQGLMLCQTGAPEKGLKMLEKVVEETKNDYAHHAWGNGAYYMETWGIAALGCGAWATAEEAFLEALAHDAGCVRAALGMQVLCERQQRIEEAQRFNELARRCWRRAEVQYLDAELSALRAAAASSAKPSQERHDD